MIHNGRQWADRVEHIREDHVARYRFARDVICDSLLALRGSFRVADLGSGCGYGSSILGTDASYWTVTGYEVDAEAVAFARQHFAREPDIAFREVDVCDPRRPTFCEVAVAFEVAEHVEGFFERCDMLAAARIAIVSTPNEERCRFTPEGYPWHVRHYTPAELEAAMRAMGFSELAWWHQENKAPGDVKPGPDGRVVIVVGRKPEATGGR